MDDVKTLIAGLVKEPGLLSNLVKNPQAIMRVAQLADANRNSLRAMGEVVSKLATRVAAPPAYKAPTAGTSRAQPGNGQAAAGVTGSQGVALAGIVSLAAVAGAVVVVGAVSVVALSAHPEQLQN